MHNAMAALVLLLALFSVSAQAFYIDIATGTIIVQQEQREIVATIGNDTAYEQEFGVHWSTPFASGVSPASGKIGAGKTVNVTLSVLPQEALEGSAYSCLLEVQLGSEKAFRNIKVIFKGESEPENGSDNGSTGSLSLAGLFSSAALLFTPENALNAMLAFIAAILLIAFIARFVKRLEAQKNEKR